MSRTYYLKKVILLLQESESAVHFAALAKKLQAHGIETVQIHGIEAVLLQKELLVAMQGKKEVLYITDNEDLAAYFMECKLPVLGWNYMGNLPYVMECPEEADPEYIERIYRRFCNIPWDVLQTPRCVLRETVEEDVDIFYQIYSNPEIVRYTDTLYPDIEDEKAYIREYIEKVYRYFEFGVWTVLWKETGEVIGRAGYSVREGCDLPDLGFVIALPWQGKGVAYEICDAILQYGQREYGFYKVQAVVHPENAVSLHLCKRLGFVEKGTVCEREMEHILLMREAEEDSLGI